MSERGQTFPQNLKGTAKDFISPLLSSPRPSSLCPSSGTTKFLPFRQSFSKLKDTLVTKEHQTILGVALAVRDSLILKEKFRSAIDNRY